MDETPKKIIVSKDYENTRIDKFISTYLSLPNSLVQKDLRKGRIKVNKKKVRFDHRLLMNDEVIFYKKYKINLPNKKKIVPDKLLTKFKKSIILKNENYIVINKWNGIASQGGSKINFSIDDIINIVSINGNYARLVHRLDKDTSGIMLLALNLKTSRYFYDLFSNQKIKKKYYAIVENNSYLKKGIFNNKIIEKDKEYIAETQYEMIKKIKGNLYYFRLSPKTGRKHQIRIHCSINGMPILSDKKYNKDSVYKDNNKELFLHAGEIEFKDQSGKNIIVQAEMPKHFKEYI